MQVASGRKGEWGALRAVSPIRPFGYPAFRFRLGLTGFESNDQRPRR
jgi:hypothetical protein